MCLVKTKISGCGDGDKNKMARLVSYKNKDENNRYSTFGNEINSNTNSNENLTISSSFKLLSKRNYSNQKTQKNKQSPNKDQFWRYLFCQCLCCIKLSRRLCPSCCCSRHIKFCCCCHECCDYDDDNDGDDDEDIDGKFAKVKYEMSQTPKTNETTQTVTIVKTETQPKPIKPWDWDDSLRSNSDRFLETLEYDTVDGNKSWRKGLKIPRIRITAFKRGKSQFFYFY